MNYLPLSTPSRGCGDMSRPAFLLWIVTIYLTLAIVLAETWKLLT
jgi:hypothetical protein